MTGPSQSSLHAATQQAEHIMEHKSLITRFQTAAQMPLPEQDAKSAPTAAQQRQRTAAEPQRVSLSISSVVASLIHGVSAPWCQHAMKTLKNRAQTWLLGW